ncbi:MAG: N-acetyltransferase [Thermotogae bacterium]|nr:MAG: N-acetyltransferase [Thermotogota bacterium]
MSDFKIKFATEADRAFCSDVDAELPEALLKEKLRKNELIIATKDNQPVGYLRLEYLWHKVPFIGLIYVLREYRGQGCGKEILHFLEGYLKLKGHSFLLSSSQADESAPQHWHRSSGFYECGIISALNDGGIGEIFFRKDFNG